MPSSSLAELLRENKYLEPWNNQVELKKEKEYITCKLFLFWRQIKVVSLNRWHEPK